MSNELIEKQQLPDYLIEVAKAGGPTGLEAMRSYLTPPRLKIMQPMRKDPFKSFPEGAVVVTPTNEIVCGKDGFFAVTVLYTYDEFCVHNPYKRPEGMPFIRERTFDFHSEIAQKCRNFVSEPMPEDDTKEIKYMTHINALVAIHGIDALKNIPVMLVQSGGEAKSGRKMLDLLAVKTSNGTPIYVHNLMCQEATHKPAKGGDTWEGLNWTNPTADVDVGRFVTAEQFPVFKKLYEQCEADKAKFVVNFDDEIEPVDTVTSDTL